MSPSECTTGRRAFRGAGPTAIPVGSPDARARARAQFHDIRVAFRSAAAAAPAAVIRRTPAPRARRTGGMGLANVFPAGGAPAPRRGFNLRTDEEGAP